MTLIRNCARCHLEHEVQLYRFSEPIEVRLWLFLVRRWSHFAICPVRNEPILVEVLPLKRQ